jgi:hypothetical protein
MENRESTESMENSVMTRVSAVALLAANQSCFLVSSFPGVQATGQDEPPAGGWLDWGTGGRFDAGEWWLDFGCQSQLFFLATF